VDKEDLTRHDKWLCMIWPRLRLLRELMADDGVIFISCDDNEVHHLRGAMDEIFGEDNFIASIVWQKRTSPESRLQLGAAHDYIIVYRGPNNIRLKKLALTEEQISQFSNPDNDPRGPWVSTDLTAQGFRPNQMYKITSPSGIVHQPPPNRCWSITEPEFKRLYNEGRIWFGVSGDAVPRIKTYLKESEGVSAWTWWTNKEAGDNQESKKELNSILGLSNGFDYPKPVRLLYRIIQIATGKDSIILDSFAGSGTTAHAVLALNKEDGGDRKFILVEMEDYADKITAERVRRVIRGIPKVKSAQLEKGLGGTFSYFELGKPIEMESILSGENLPTYKELARYVFFTATGERLHESGMDEEKFFVGESKSYHVYLFYRPDVAFLKSTALTLEHAKALGDANGKRRLIFAPTKYLDQDYLDQFRIDFSQLPFEIYRMAR
jgi:adenine-specific DNA-methyltransferase